MCIVIDTNTLSKVFKNTDKKHSDFKPVLEWIKEGNGKIIVGGTTFNNELFEEVQWFIKAYRLLRQYNKVVEIDKKKVELPSAIKEFGSYDASVRLYAGVVAPFKLKVEEL